MTTGPAQPPQEPPIVNAPELEGGEWLQGGPVPVRSRGKPLLVDFWDYTCNNCIRTMPYLAEWHRRYAAHGLEIVGVHTPEFDFARNPARVLEAIADLGVPYPVVLDSQYAIWQAYANRFWPSKYFVDAQGKIRAQSVGEGSYGEAEQVLQALLREQDGFDAELPPLMEPLRPEDGPGAVCYRVTPELYCGFGRGMIGNPGGPQPDRPHRYVDPGKHVEGALYLEGDWMVSAENAARPFGAKGPSRMTFTYMAADVNLVLHPPVAGGLGVVRVILDGAPVEGEAAGEDVAGGGVNVEKPRMYRLVRGVDVERHTLTLETESDGLAAFAFTFTSCLAPPPEMPPGAPPAAEAPPG
jgi:thiol-disulfide isomerase/thioredoxin